MAIKQQTGAPFGLNVPKEAPILRPAFFCKTILQ